MKKTLFFIASIILVFSISSCKKEVIEIVNDEASIENVDLVRKSTVTEDPGTDIFGGVTDPNEDEDFDRDKKNNIKQGQ